MKTLPREVHEADSSELLEIIGQLAEQLSYALNRAGLGRHAGIRSDIGLYFRPLVSEYFGAIGATPEHISELLSELIGDGATVLEDIREGYRITEWAEHAAANDIAKRIARASAAL